MTQEKDKEIIEKIKKAHEEFVKEISEFDQKRKDIMKEYREDSNKQKIENLRKKLKEM